MASLNVKPKNLSSEVIYLVQLLKVLEKNKWFFKKIKINLIGKLCGKGVLFT